MYYATECGHSRWKAIVIGILWHRHLRKGLLAASALATTSICHAQSNSQIIGVVDGYSSNGALSGWACSTGLDQSISVHVYVGGPAGSGTAVGAFSANQPSESAVAAACSASGTHYRFSIAFSDAVRQQHAGKAIYVHGISPVGGANLTIGSSGTYNITAVPPPPPLFFRTETISYHDNTTKWVLGQVASRSVNGVVAEQTTYDASTAMPVQSLSFGKLKQTLTYNADGTVATVKDGNNNVTTLSSWKRGVPQSITYADGKTRSAVVNDNGWITRVTDENGYATNYTYDAMGRLAQTDYPIADSVNWNVSGRQFRAVNSGDWKPAGVVDGQWRLQEITGNHITYTYYDALWRPVLRHNYDISNVPGTLQSTSTEYDARGHIVFQSYPSSDIIPAPQGIWTFYDALDRPTHVKQDSEHGLLLTTTSYLNDALGAYTLVKDPRGGETRTWYQMFDQPSYDAPVRIAQPEDVLTTITRDVFGKPTAITRGNGAGSLQVTRTYAYNGYQELCRAVEPETGASLMGYDGAGNLSWSASGLPATQGCETDGLSANVAPRRVVRSYDNRNRLHELWFPDGRGNQMWTYHADGLPFQVWTNNVSGGEQVINRYYYNKRRLLTHEQVEQPGWYTWGLSYGYDANGSIASQGYPTGNIITYSPNALGQPTYVVGASDGHIYASGISYYPNGALKAFHYGNNLQHNMTQNARQLPSRVTDGGGALDYDYAYDVNGNVAHIYDYIPDLTPGSTPKHRYFNYDGLNRLTSAGSAIFGGNHWHTFSYDALDNLRSWTLGLGGKDYANYNYEPGTNRLVGIQNAGGATIVGLAYDVQGNLQNKNGQLYDFDFGNRLRSTPSQGSMYRYDAHGRRVAFNDIPAGLMTLSQYSHAGQLMYYEKGHDGLEHIYLGGGLVAIRNAGINSVNFQHTDALGSPVAVTDAAANVIERNVYEPYGAIIGKPAYDAVGYTGHKQDAATGLTYMQQRYYDPQIGRFLSVDPVTAYNNPVGAFNRYWYANNNPYKFTDPDGRQPLPREMNRVPTLLEAKGHWQDGNGQAVRVPISAVNLQGLASGREFTGSPAIRRAGDAIKDFESNNNGLRPTSVGVSWSGKEDNVSYQTVGEQSTVLGKLSMKIEGALTFSSEAGRWNFDGTIKFFDDPYDFNMDMSRPVRSALTVGGMLYNGKGTPFDIEIRGAQQVNVQFPMDWP